eukprot:19715-Heterococcus_DN1.PRE.2
MKCCCISALDSRKHCNASELSSTHMPSATSFPSSCSLSSPMKRRASGNLSAAMESAAGGSGSAAAASAAAAPQQMHANAACRCCAAE